MHRIALLLLFAALAAAQDNPFSKPPADVDAALRARIKVFYDYHVQGQFRKADELVAEDTKDYYFNSGKPKYLSYEISRIDYSDHFTKAKAVIMCEMLIMMPGFADKPVKMPTPSAWKLVDGQWYWYVDQQAVRDSPFGQMKPGPDVKPGQTIPGSALGFASINMSPEFLFKQIKLNKEEVSIVAGESAEVLVTNSAPGAMNLSAKALSEGVEAKLEKSTLQSNETAILKIATTKDARPGVVNLTVEQTGQVIPIQIKMK
jgi:hypothetical protein